MIFGCFKRKFNVFCRNRYELKEKIWGEIEFILNIIQPEIIIISIYCTNKKKKNYNRISVKNFVSGHWNFHSDNWKFNNHRFLGDLIKNSSFVEYRRKSRFKLNNSTLKQNHHKKISCWASKTQSSNPLNFRGYKLFIQIFF